LESDYKLTKIIIYNTIKGVVVVSRPKSKDIDKILDNGMGSEEMAVLHELDENDTDRELFSVYGGKILTQTLYGGMNFN
jgi:hypothetical protein